MRKVIYKCNVCAHVPMCAHVHYTFMYMRVYECMLIVQHVPRVCVCVRAYIYVCPCAFDIYVCSCTIVHVHARLHMYLPAEKCLDPGPVV